MTSVLRISIAPVKSLRLAHPVEIALGIGGARGDRRFFLVDAAGRLFNGKRSAMLTRVEAAYADDETALVLRFPDGAEVRGPIDLDDEIATTFYGETIAARRVRGPWSRALGRFVGEPVQLVAVPEDAGGVDRGADAGASLISRASLDELARVGGRSAPIDGRRFRMLFEVDGLGAHEEDALVGRKTRIGEAVVRWTGNVGRCVVTTRDPETGAVDLPTLRILGRYRREAMTTEPLAFGIYGQVVRAGRVRLGDPLIAL